MRGSSGFYYFFIGGGWGPSQETTEPSLLPSVRDHAIRSAVLKFLSHDIVFKINCHARQTTCRFIYVSVPANARRVGSIYKMLSL